MQPALQRQIDQRPERYQSSWLVAFVGPALAFVGKLSPQLKQYGFGLPPQHQIVSSNARRSAAEMGQHKAYGHIHKSVVLFYVLPGP